MKLSKTALRELSAKYRAVLMKCALMNMMIFAGALMPHTAEARELTADDKRENNSIVFTTEDSIFDGKGKYTVSSTNDTTMTVIGDGTLKNITLEAKKIDASQSLTLNIIDSTLNSDSIEAKNINVNGTLTVTDTDTFSADCITGADGAEVHFRSKSTMSLKSSNGKLKISNVLLDFEKTDINFQDADFTNTRMKTSLELPDSIRFGYASFNGNNTITANSILAPSITVSVNGSLTLKNLDGTGNGLLTGGLNLYGHFTGDMKDGILNLNACSDWSFNGKLNVDKVDAYFIDGDALDMSNLKLAAGSSINVLSISNKISNESSITTSRMIVNSDLSVNELQIYNSNTSAKTVAQITGTGTLKTETIYQEDYAHSNDVTVHFDGINISALKNDLTFDGYGDARYDFTNNAISAGNNIAFNQKAVFNGNSSLTATLITAGNMIVNGALTVNGELSANDINLKNGGTLTMNGKLGAGQIIGGTLNIVLPETVGTSPIITANAKDVTLTLDLKNVTNKDAAQKYLLTNSTDGYTLSGNYDKWAFSDHEFTLDDWKAKKDAFSFANAWNASNGTLWILKVAGGAQAAIDDLRMAGIFVSPAEENASKILDMLNNNPFADALTDLLDSGDAALQQQALREIVPTDAAASAFKSAKNAANAVMNAVSGRLGGSSAVSGRSGGDLTVGKASAWAQGMFNHAKMTGGFKSDTAGFSAGVETNLTDEIKAGVGYAYASTGIKTSRSKTDVDTNTGFVYGEYAPNALYVNAMLGFGRSDYDDKTKLAGMSNSYKADTYSARVAAGYDLGMLTPEAALRFTSVRQKAYTDDLGARVAAKNLNTATLVVGAKAAKTFTVGKYAVEPEAKAALTYDIARPNEDRAVALPDGSSYAAAGEKLNRLGFEIGAKAAVRLTNEVELSVSYDGAFKERYRDHTGLINLKVGF